MPSFHDQPAQGLPVAEPDGRSAGLVVGAGAGLLLVALGGVLWWLRGEAVFTDTVLGALAWCF